VVTATYSDGSTAAVTGYTLSGEIAEGENIITVSYGGVTATFAVTGIAEESGEVEKTLFTGEKIITEDDLEDTRVSPYGLMSKESLTLSAGTYYLYSVYKTNSGIPAQLYTDSDGTLTDVTSSYATVTRSGAFKTGTYDPSNSSIEKSNYYQPNGAGYLVEIKIVVNEEFTGKLRLGVTGQCYALTETGWTFLTTEQFNPYKQRLS
jgi:hypothetical protein